MRPTNAARIEPDPTCPSCGRAIDDPETGACAHCGAPAEPFARTAGPSRILSLSDLPRARAKARSPRWHLWARQVLALILGTLAALAILGLFGALLRGAEALFTRGAPPA